MSQARHGFFQQELELFKKKLAEHKKLQVELNKQNALWFTLNRHRFSKMKPGTTVSVEQVEACVKAFGNFLHTNKLFQQLNKVEKEVSRLKHRLALPEPMVSHLKTKL